MSFEVGDQVKVPCAIQPGAFPHERLVTIEQEQHDLSGFVQSEFLEMSGRDTGFVRAEIIAVKQETVTLRIPGSFFTTAMGRAWMPRAWAAEHLIRSSDS